MLRTSRLSKLEIIQIILIGFGAVLLLIGANLDLYWMINLGLLLAGAGVLSSGIDTLVTNRISYWSYLFDSLYGSGVRAFLAGVLFTLIGIWLWTLASIRILGVEPQAKEFLASHPGVYLTNAALFLFLLGTFSLLRLEGWRATYQNVLRALPFLLVGGFLFAVAFLALVFGLYALLNPAAFNGWLIGVPGS